MKKIDSDNKLISENIPELKEHQIITMIKNKKKSEPNNIIFDLINKIKELDDIKHNDRYISILEEKKLDMIKNTLGNNAYYGKRKKIQKIEKIFGEKIKQIDPSIQEEYNKLKNQMIIEENDIFFNLLKREKKYRIVIKNYFIQRIKILNINYLIL